MIKFASTFFLEVSIYRDNLWANNFTPRLIDEFDSYNTIMAITELEDNRHIWNPISEIIFYLNVYSHSHVHFDSSSHQPH